MFLIRCAKLTHNAVQFFRILILCVYYARDNLRGEGLQVFSHSCFEPKLPDFPIILMRTTVVQLLSVWTLTCACVLFLHLPPEILSRSGHNFRDIQFNGSPALDKDAVAEEVKKVCSCAQNPFPWDQAWS